MIHNFNNFTKILAYYSLDILNGMIIISFKNAECPDSTENIETQLMIHDIHKEQVDLKSHCRHSEQSIQWQEKYSKDYLNSFSASLDDVLPQHSETYTINMPCHNVQNESNVNLMDNNSREIDTNFEESKWRVTCK